LSIVYRVVGRRGWEILSDWECLICGRKYWGVLEFKRHLEQDHDLKNIEFSYTDAVVDVEAKSS